MKRRSFLQCAAAPILAGNAGFAVAAGNNTREKKKNMNEEIEKRPLGKTGEKLSCIGFGGIVVSKVEQSKANEAVARAVEYGINYFDVAPTYGNAEERLGPALEPFRNDVFLACKTTERSRKSGSYSQIAGVGYRYFPDTIVACRRRFFPWLYDMSGNSLTCGFHARIQLANLLALSGRRQIANQRKSPQPTHLRRFLENTSDRNLCFQAITKQRCLGHGHSPRSP